MIYKMNKQYKIILLFAVLMIILVVAPSYSFAQIVDPGCDPADPSCPIDGGVSLLIAAGIGLGAKRAMHKKK